MPDTIAAVVLAAGLSSRFPGDKLLHPLRGKPLAAHIADTLAEVPLAHRMAVCAAGKPARRELFAARGYEIVVNADPGRGMASSLALAARRAIELGADALLVCLADMPNVTVAHLRQLMLASGSAAATMVGGRYGPPALLGRELLPAVTELTGDKGARDLLSHATMVAADPDLGSDYDTLADFG